MERFVGSLFSFRELRLQWPVPRYNIAVDGHCLPELGTSVLELSVFLQPKHGAFNNGSQDAFVVCAVPLQHGPRLPLFLEFLFSCFFPLSLLKHVDVATDNQVHLIQIRGYWLLMEPPVSERTGGNLVRAERFGPRPGMGCMTRERVSSPGAPLKKTQGPGKAAMVIS